MRKAGLVLAGWLIPGGALLLMRRYAQFAVFAVLVCGTFAAGVALHGGYQWPGAADFAGLPGFDALVARAGALTETLAGAPYLAAQLARNPQPWLSGRLHEYGTTLLLMSGLFNVLAVASALEPAEKAGR
jgi:hypothetical protein